jgi:hypothetical protein
VLRYALLDCIKANRLLVEERLIHWIELCCQRCTIMSHMSAANGHTISPLELESLANDGKETRSPSEGRQTLERLSMLLRLYYELHPKTVLTASAFFVGLVLFWWSPWTAMGGRHSMRNYMTRDYTALEDNFSFKSAQIDHWCLFGGDDKCYCEGKKLVLQCRTVYVGSHSIKHIQL